MQIFLTKGLAETAALWSDVKPGYAWVHRAAHILSNDEQLTAVQVRQTYEMFLAEMEHTPISSETLTTMLSTFRKVTTSYWPGLFHCYDHADLPRTNNALEQYLARRGIMNGESREENKHPPALSSGEPFGWLPPSLPACIPFLEQSFVPLISRNGELCGVNCIIVTRHGVCSIVSAKLLKATSQPSKRSSAKKDYRRRKK